MEKRFWTISSVLLVILAVSMLSWKDIQSAPGIPDEVLKIISNSCFDCHTTGAKSEDAVKSLDFKKWDEYTSIKKISILSDIQEVIGKGQMPPEKYLDKYPKKSISEDDRNKIINWAKEETAKLME